MPQRVLVTGGAGFIGSHIVDMLVAHGHEVVIIDSLEPQVHDGKPAYLNSEAEFVEGDVRNRNLLVPILQRVDAVCHQASLVGVGQSMYEVERYVDGNAGATATLLDAIVTAGAAGAVSKVVLASSMSVYGEGEYECARCESPARVVRRDATLLSRGRWDPVCAECGAVLKHRATRETAIPCSTSIYALTKQFQETAALLLGEAYAIPTIALRYFNVYGPRQSISNPYTGVAAIFMSRVKNGHPPIVYEDGEQLRDFIHVEDIARANVAAIEAPFPGVHVANVGTGRPVSILAIADTLLGHYGVADRLSAELPGEFRAGDIRHCYADVARAHALLGFEASVRIEDGLRRLVEWASDRPSRDSFDIAEGELRNAGLLGRVEG
jgi:dTDP-L-rhamnose 4-epimerase